MKKESLRPLKEILVCTLFHSSLSGCRISATEFEKNASKGFRFHVTNEHNVFDYLRLLMKLEHDFDGSVYSHYLRRRLLRQAHPIGTFPIGRALVGHV
eukprot:m.694233 g.694233  ORF g.694233 m.694233 type:complete len:98 (+) comp22878_c0_seq9:2887-3180(+)